PQRLRPSQAVGGEARIEREEQGRGDDRDENHDRRQEQEKRRAEPLEGPRHPDATDRRGDTGCSGRHSGWSLKAGPLTPRLRRHEGPYRILPASWRILVAF